MNILIVGSGGREHALAWKASHSAKVETVYVAPGNAGTAMEANIENINISAEDQQALLQFAQEKNIGLTIIGPEVPLVAGIVDLFQANNLACFGPSQKAAQLEASKAYTKDFLERHNIPTAFYSSFNDADSAVDYLKQQTLPVVIKADGLAAGKGVVIVEDLQHGIDTIHSMMQAGKFGSAGERIVIEEFLQGEEASFIAMVDGKNILPLATSQDHKARDEGDKGPNTGGMGAYSPAPIIDDALHQRIMNEVMIPTVEGMAAEGAPYTGFLYAGVMITADGTPKVLEFNCRFGDPETQPIMMRLQSDLVELCFAALDGKLDKTTVKWDPRVALGVVLAAGGYPDSYRKGDVISGLDKVSSGKVFHAGTATSNGNVVTNGGRVLCVCGLGDNALQAQAAAYASVASINWADIQYRKDIGHRAVSRLAE
ncbi:MAG: phosphoribosylamine--glycine ligase [Gammaproteobacteria bacterium]|nr:phosphoribosylamine--glycine ligase [Gammaproteobacteria bacterium]